jgi:hypothetical protein
MAYDPTDTRDPGVLAELARLEYAADLVLYPALGGDHSALHRLLGTFVDEQYPSVPARLEPVLAPAGSGAVAVLWAQGAEPERVFVGRREELSKLDRWAGDPTVRIVGVTAWGGAGKTALVSQWVDRAGGANLRPGVRGVFGWSFYADPNPDAWAKAVLDWAGTTLHVPAEGSDSASRIIGLLKAEPVVLVLDGLEVLQEGPAGRGGRSAGSLMGYCARS